MLPHPHPGQLREFLDATEGIATKYHIHEPRIERVDLTTESFAVCYVIVETPLITNAEMIKPINTWPLHRF